MYLTRNAAGSIRYEVQDYVLSPTVDRKISNYSLRSKKGILTYQFKDSISEESAKRYLTQHILQQLHRVNPYQLKPTFQERLAEKEIKAKVGVLCLRDSIRYWSEADSIVPKKAYSTPRQVLDITGKIKVQAWADYSTSTFFAHLDPVTYVFLILLIGVLMWIWPTNKAIKKAPQE